MQNQLTNGHFNSPFQFLLLPSSIPPKPQIHLLSPLKLNRIATQSHSNSNRGFLKTTQLLPSKCLRKSGRIFVIGESDTSVTKDVLVGEDSANFDLAKQKITSWIFFTVVLGVVLFILDIAWLDNSTGFGKIFIDSLSSVSDSPEVAMFLLTLIFAVVHSGLASVRDPGEKLIGERAFRVLFAGTSLPLAVSTIVYFINHRYDGVQLWQLQSVLWLHYLLWITNFISFFFLYPSTFNLLEVAAVDKPKMHLWESGIMRITRHPQLVDKPEIHHRLLQTQQKRYLDFTRWGSITGTEAMFADLGHFTVKSIQISMGCVVYPDLMMAYSGQASWLT